MEHSAASDPQPKISIKSFPALLTTLLGLSAAKLCPSRSVAFGTADIGQGTICDGGVPVRVRSRNLWDILLVAWFLLDLFLPKLTLREKPIQFLDQFQELQCLSSLWLLYHSSQIFPESSTPLEEIFFSYL